MSDLLQQFSEWIIYSLLGFSAGTLTDALVYFIYDSIKIIFLLFLMIFGMGVIRTYISQERIRTLLSGKIPILPNFFASLFGAVTPFCSCSSIPIFISFLEAGVPLGTSLSFLATSPLVNEYAAVLVLSFFGPTVAIAYVLSGIFLGMFAGVFIGKMGMEKHLVADMIVRKKKETSFSSFKERLQFGYSEAKEIVGKLWLWIFVGVGVGAVIHGFVPEELVHSILSIGGPFAVIPAVLIGIPIYANCAAVIPIAAVLFEKGVPLGTALAFVMSVATLSLPEAIILRRVMKLPLLALFFGIVALEIMVIGILFNILF